MSVVQSQMEFLQLVDCMQDLVYQDKLSVLRFLVFVQFVYPKVLRVLGLISYNFFEFGVVALVFSMHWVSIFR